MLRAAVALVLLLGASACGDDGSSADPEEYCTRLDRLTDNDPFQAFGPTASNAQIEEAFTALVERADELAEVAPEEARAATDDFADSARELDELMADVGYDGSKVDTTAYRNAQVTYSEASTRLLRYLTSSCAHQAPGT